MSGGVLRDHARHLGNTHAEPGGDKNLFYIATKALTLHRYQSTNCPSICNKVKNTSPGTILTHLKANFNAIIQINFSEIDMIVERAPLFCHIRASWARILPATDWVTKQIHLLWYSSSRRSNPFFGFFLFHRLGGHICPNFEDFQKTKVDLCQWKQSFVVTSTDVTRSSAPRLGKALWRQKSTVR